MMCKRFALLAGVVNGLSLIRCEASYVAYGLGVACPDDINVKPREISIVEFTPDTAGKFTILHEVHGITGELIVEEDE